MKLAESPRPLCFSGLSLYSTLFLHARDCPEMLTQLDRVCAHNWRHGTCSHDLLFQATDPVQHVAWAGDELSFGTEGGGTWIISRSTGHVVDVFEGHDGEVTGEHKEQQLVCMCVYECVCARAHAYVHRTPVQ